MFFLLKVVDNENDHEYDTFFSFLFFFIFFNNLEYDDTVVVKQYKKLQRS